MRIVSYNIEWFDALFDDAGELLVDDRWSARRDVTRAMQAEALGLVLTAIDADAIMVIEAPDTNTRRSSVRALQNFAEAFALRADRAVIGYPNQTQQEIAWMCATIRRVWRVRRMRPALTDISASTSTWTRRRMTSPSPSHRWNWR